MKKLLIILFIMLLLAVCKVNSEQENEYDQQTIQNAKASVESYLVNNYTNINNIQLDEPYQAPMGSMTIDGTVNETENFSISLNSDLTIGSLAIQSDNFPEEKDECKEKTCDY
ncbi:hypothetical protein J5S49_05020 [Virgibacillus halodenitrificans]|uniref:hypothetical protein n=1 Tax=Virgibacillus halodenitrificans TaxID=1482 RepID=UPI001F39E2A2|nr:hypothetical protein [Virgibacillus halodenitrificans]MCG1027644.1 hypothetical protein [Virgibacillus halodenitrificans]